MKNERIVIVGGGPVGAVLALALHQHGIPATLLEARAKGASHTDERALALSHGTRMIFERMGVWAEIETRATPIHSIHVSQRGGLGRTRLNAQEHNLPALGYVAPYGALTQALDKALDAASKHVETLHEAVVLKVSPNKDFGQVVFRYDEQEKTLLSPLVVVADGGSSLSEIAGIERETKEYGHNALISKVQCELPHNHVAYERFTPKGPMALLPNGARDFSLVWTGEKIYVDSLLALDDATFLRELHEAFGDRVGKFLSVDKRMSFPLKLSQLKPGTAPHVAVIGNAAQTMHPVAGQGFNVGLRDAITLAEVIDNTPVNTRGYEQMLQSYGKRRQHDTKRGLLFTDFLVNVFSNDLLGVSALRGAGLGLLGVFSPAKKMLVEKMSFGK